MTKKRKRNIVIIVVFGVIVAWQFGLFNRFNYLTAKIAIMRDNPRMIIVGEADSCGQPCIDLRAKYGFEEKHFGYKATGAQLRGINDYNYEIENHLIKRNGEGWKEKYEAELAELKAN
ncbi:FEKKY domain-containing protein [Brumimicrobium mesophilum]|uniref:FEKKY domain-containing protein n=1 Tax=Brumimicrobium mesophilum TaxID=392717 RepID=UPI000D1400D0|nr:hypothetical protein [Brumimicrobium mesophilum]